MKLSACIFDLDGVIVDTAKYHYLAWKKIANQLGLEFTTVHNEKLKGLSRMHSLEQILSLGDLEYSEKDKAKLCASKNQLYLDYITDVNESEILPGVADFLDELDQQGVIYALGSASRNARLILEKVGLSKRFKAVVDGNDVTNTKPNPEVFLKAAGQLGFPPAETVVFEDSQKGLEAARNGGFMVVGIGEPEHLSQWDCLFQDFTQFDLTSITDELMAVVNQ